MGVETVGKNEKGSPLLATSPPRSLPDHRHHGSADASSNNTTQALCPSSHSSVKAAVASVTSSASLRHYMRAISSVIVSAIPWSKKGRCDMFSRTFNLDDANECCHFRRLFKSCILLTYRHHFDDLYCDSRRSGSYSMTETKPFMLQNLLGVLFPSSNRPRFRCISDSGWGCTIRVYQMSVCHTLRNLCLGSMWERPYGRETCDHYPDNLVPILNLCRDTKEARFSIQRVVSIGRDYLGISIGDWFGPTSCADAFTRLINEEPNLDIRNYQGQTIRLKAYHSANGDIDMHQVKNLFENEEIIIKKLRSSVSERGLYDNTSSSLDNSLQSPQSQPIRDIDGSPKIAVTVFLSLRLGLDSFNMAYKSFILNCFRLKGFQGIAGGGPLTSAYWFIAASEDLLFYLDPHTMTQEAFKSLTIHRNSSKIISVYLNNQPITLNNFEKSFFPDQPKVLTWTCLNPSMTLVCLCESFNDFSHLCSSIKSYDDQGVFNICQRSIAAPIWQSHMDDNGFLIL